MFNKTAIYAPDRQKTDYMIITIISTCGGILTCDAAHIQRETDRESDRIKYG